MLPLHPTPSAASAMATALMALSYRMIVRVALVSCLALGCVRHLPPAPTPEPEGTYYEVKKGDTLSKIAKAQYGDAMKYPQIFEANRPMLKDPDKIYPGQVLRIPPL